MRGFVVFAILFVTVLTCRDSTGSNHDGVKVLWRAPLGTPTGGGWLGSPATGGGNVYFEVWGKSVVALDTATGALRWSTRVQTGGDSPTSENIVYGHGKVVIAETSAVVALDANIGIEKWRFTPDSHATLSRNAVDDRAFYVGTRGAHVYALDATAGTVLWHVRIDSTWKNFSVVRGIATSGDSVYVNVTRFLDEWGASRTGVVVALNRLTGAELWRYQMPETANDATGAPAIAGMFLIVNDVFGGSFFAVNRFTGQRVWKVSTGGLGASASPIVRDGRVYVGAGSGRLIAADLSSGTVIWQKTPGSTLGGLAICGTTAIAQGLNIYRLELDSGRLLGTLFDEYNAADVPQSGVVASGSRSFVSSPTYVYAISC